MALVSLNDAARMVRKNRTTLMRDIERGHLHQTMLQDGDVRIDTAELLRAYGHLHRPETEPKRNQRNAGERQKIALLEQRIQALERVIALEAELRRAKDQVTSELRARLVDKDNIIKLLEGKVALLEYEQQVQAIPMLDPADRISGSLADASPSAPAHTAVSPPASPDAPRFGWWSRWFGPRRAAQK